MKKSDKQRAIIIHTWRGLAYLTREKTPQTTIGVSDARHRHRRSRGSWHRLRQCRGGGRERRTDARTRRNLVLNDLFIFFGGCVFAFLGVWYCFVALVRKRERKRRINLCFIFLRGTCFFGGVCADLCSKEKRDIAFFRRKKPRSSTRRQGLYLECTLMVSTPSICCCHSPNHMIFGKNVNIRLRSARPDLFIHEWEWLFAVN